MHYYHKKKQFLIISYVLCIVFLLHMLIAPTANTMVKTADSDSKHKTYTSFKWKPLSKIGKLRITLDINEIEQLSDLAFIQMASGGYSNYQRILNKVFHAMLMPVSGIVIAYYFILYSFRKSDQNKSLMAFSIGGHAPPVLLM